MYEPGWLHGAPGGFSGSFHELVVMSGDFAIILGLNIAIEDAAEDIWFHVNVSVRANSIGCHGTRPGDRDFHTLDLLNHGFLFLRNA